MLKEFVLEAVENAHSIYKKRFSDIMNNFSEESVHDYRVAIRRSLALCSLLGKVIPNNYITEIKAIIKSQLKVLNPLRDTQVQIILLKKEIYNHPALFGYYMKLLNDEQLYIATVKENITREDYEDMDSLLFFLKIRFKNDLSLMYLDMIKMTDEAGNAFKEIMLAKDRMNANDLDTVHKLRLAFKKYRYIVENLLNFIAYPKVTLKKLKQIQTLLGEIQDSRVYLAGLSVYVADQPEEAKPFYSNSIKDILIKQKKLLYDLSECLMFTDTLWKEEYFKVKSESSQTTL